MPTFANRRVLDGQKIFVKHGGIRDFTEAAADFAERIRNIPRSRRTSPERERISREAKTTFPMRRRFWIGHVKIHCVAISLSWLESIQSDGIGVCRNIVGEIDGEPIDGADG
jgi:hypothetical protein